MKKIKLTESQLHSIIKEAVTNVLKAQDYKNYVDSGKFYDGVAWVKNAKGKYNYIKPNDELLSDVWFDEAYDFNDGCGVVKYKGKYNFVNTLGDLVSDKWFKDVNKFKNGFAAVMRNDGKWNFINSIGEIISKTWFDKCYYFEKDGGEVMINGKIKYIDSNGKLLLQRKERGF